MFKYKSYSLLLVKVLFKFSNIKITYMKLRLAHIVHIVLSFLKLQWNNTLSNWNSPFNNHSLSQKHCRINRRKCLLNINIQVSVAVSEVFQFMNSEDFLDVPLCTWSVSSGFHLMRELESDFEDMQGKTLYMAAIQVCIMIIFSIHKNKFAYTIIVCTIYVITGNIPRQLASVKL